MSGEGAAAGAIEGEHPPPRGLAPTESGSSAAKDKKQSLASLDMTTAMGSTLDPEDHTLLDQKESEEDLKDILNSRVLELEKQLKQTNEYYEKLCKDVVAVKSLYEREREECEDVVSVAKRNIEGQVAKILELQSQKRALSAKINEEEDKLQKEENKTRVQLKSEEERLTRNVVILQTKLLINEAIQFERDQLLSNIRALEIDLVEKENHYQKELQSAKDQIQQKYERLHKIINDHRGSISERVKTLSLRQQIAAMKHAQKEIISTQTAYRKASRNLLQMLDKNKILRQKNHKLNVHVTLQKSLMSAAKAEAEKLLKAQERDSLKEPTEDETELKEESKDLTETKEKLEEIRRKIEKFKNEFYRGKDEEDELNEILEDQRTYLSVLKEQKERLHDVEQRLIPLSDVAEYIAKKGKVVLKEDFGDPLIRYDVFQKLSAIISESEKLQKYTKFTTEKSVTPVSEILTTPSPIDEKVKNPKKLLEGTELKNICFTRQLDKVEKKILSELGLLGKYGRKQKKFSGF